MKLHIHLILSCLIPSCAAFTTNTHVNAFNQHQLQSPSPSASTRLFSQQLKSDESPTNKNTAATSTTSTSRRNLFNGLLTSASASAAGLVLGIGVNSINVQPSYAFENKISNKYDDRPKRRGPQPKDLGISTRKDMVGEEYLGLKPCGPAPNCFCSTDDINDDPEHNIPPWIFPEGMDVESAFVALDRTIKAYQPGQGNIDGGGFQIVSTTTTATTAAASKSQSQPKDGYMYVQFESLKNGYIDDVEFAYVKGGIGGERAVQVRSSSRVGYLDFGVNAKRLNYIAKALRAEGWDAKGVDPATHQDYVVQNSAS